MGHVGCMEQNLRNVPDYWTDIPSYTGCPKKKFMLGNQHNFEQIVTMRIIYVQTRTPDDKKTS